MIGYYAGLDIGGTNGRLKICDPDGAVLGEFTAPGCSLNTDGMEKAGFDTVVWCSRRLMS
uniref:hypothetical protein n=1 Tax=Clostridium sp. NkU-1 TaxID=1095009 RepID=UPI0032614299